MKSTETTRKLSYGILGLFTIYGIFAIPFAFFLLAAAIGLSSTAYLNLLKLQLLQH